MSNYKNIVLYIRPGQQNRCGSGSGIRGIESSEIDPHPCKNGRGTGT